MAVHVLVFPFPSQGHLNCMLHFAELLAGAAAFDVSFLLTDDNRRRLARPASAATLPRLRFVSITDGLPDDHPRLPSKTRVMELSASLRAGGSAAYRALLASLLCSSPSPGDGFPPLTCVVADGVMPFAVDIAEELGVPALAFRTASAWSVLAYLSAPKLLDVGELPFPEGGDLDELVRGMPGIGGAGEESFLRRRDLPGAFQGCKDPDDPMLQMLTAVTAHNGKARAVIFNTSPSLEAPALAHIAPHMRDTFAVGPLHAIPGAAAAAPASLWDEDHSCIEWLDGQPERSVVYVSLGSVTVISHEEFAEFLSGLVGAGYPFLWVLRPGMVGGGASESESEALLRQAAAGDRARVVPWAPQRDVLRHRAVGCFLTHCGWNSTVEAAAEAVPTVCWPFSFDQPTNSRVVAAVWRTGVDMKDVCDRAVVERMVREVMDMDGSPAAQEIRRSARKLQQAVRRDVADGGSSATELKRLVAFIRDLSARAAE